jgi:hypothetical protein
LKKENKEEKGEMARGLFSQGRAPYWLPVPGFFWLLGAIKRCFVGQCLNFVCT